MQLHQTSMRFLARLFCTLGVSAALSASSPAVAALSTYQFSLNPSPQFSYWGVVGSGYFTVDDTTVPDSGSFMAVATDLAGRLITGRDFGYAFGNTEVSGTPDNAVRLQTPHTDAVISFEDGVPTGISYEEVHLCGVATHCLPNHQIHLLGAAFDVFDYPSLGATGDVAISPAIAEPSTVALLLAGLGAVALRRRRR